MDASRKKRGGRASVSERACHPVLSASARSPVVPPRFDRTLEACIEFLQQIKRWCYSQMLETYKHESKKPAKKRRLIVFVSDKFVNYKTSWKKLFYRITILRFGVPIACKKFGLKHNNNSVERHNRVECTPKSGQIDNEVQLPGGEEKVHYDKAK